ncbi:hypothetical protein Tco_1319911 [Tanacetum coccineum]
MSKEAPQLMYPKGGSYVSTAPKLEVARFSKWKKRMICYLVGMEPYLIKCIEDGLFVPKTTANLPKLKTYGRMMREGCLSKKWLNLNQGLKKPNRVTDLDVDGRYLPNKMPNQNTRRMLDPTLDRSLLPVKDGE